MNSHKMSVSIPDYLYDFIGNYQEKHDCKTRSEVISRALTLLQRLELEASYREANRELEVDEWDVTVGDGLDDDETW